MEIFVYTLSSRIIMELKEYVSLPKNPTYDEYLDAVVEKIGLENLKPCLPVSLDELKEAYAKDIHFNNIPLRKWDVACGYREIPSYPPRYYPVPSQFQTLLETTFSQSISVAGAISILKHAARQLVERDQA